ncbi:hypothetical protein B0E46_00190 [Rhodanobacter sp. B04]|nr:hypothetical protein B0E51_13420 [Rhodanobacter sp. C05]OOG52297.1 hypothetical protein B0E48_17150 [Rhodanobacter sp. C03]OOG65972.1 hypothetical protein B0E46_00190 [Rhodanobacter sp. B04]
MKFDVKAAIARCTSLAFVFLLVGCGDHQSLPPQRPVAILKDDVCEICGMYIEASSGPRSEACLKSSDKPLKFDSTRYFPAYVLRPGNELRLEHFFCRRVRVLTGIIRRTPPRGKVMQLSTACSGFHITWIKLQTALSCC